MHSPLLQWNKRVKIIISDVDETIADNFTPAEPAMIKELTSLLEEGKILFMVTGASLQRVQMRIVDFLPKHLRKQVLVAHCSGAEVWGFLSDGSLQTSPFYSLYDSSLSEEQKKVWREVVQQLIQEFHLKTFEPLPVWNLRKRWVMIP